MALNIELDGFGFLDEDSVIKLSPTFKQVSSPLSESSGISSLDSDDLKKQLLVSPPTISISHDHEEEEEEEEDDDDQHKQHQTLDYNNEGVEFNETKGDDDKIEVDNDKSEVKKYAHADLNNKKTIDIAEKVIFAEPLKVIYQNRDVLDLFGNIWNSSRSKEFVNYTVLPENNLSCFFQNRAQYWRLANPNERFETLEKCMCCDFFSYPVVNPTTNQKPGIASSYKNTSNNAITNSLLTFLKNHHTDCQNVMSNNNNNNNNSMNCSINVVNKRTYNNNASSVPYAAYQMIQKQQQQQYHNNNNNNGYYTSANTGYNQINAYNNTATVANNNNNSNNNNNNNNIYNNGTTLALLNLMNQRSISSAAGAFQAMNNSSRYFNNNMNTNYGLYKQF